MLHDFYEFSPQKFLNVTNGVTPRRWLALSNPELSQLITSKVGEEWIMHEERLQQLARRASGADSACHARGAFAGEHTVPHILSGRQLSPTHD